jgi:hypothetical protein
MWYFSFNSPEEFVSYQNTLIKNWKREHECYSSLDEIDTSSYLFRGTGRTSCEVECIRQLLSRGETVVYVVYKPAHKYHLNHDSVILRYRNKLRIMSFTDYKNDSKDIYVSVLEKIERKHVIFDHLVFEMCSP